MIRDVHPFTFGLENCLCASIRPKRSMATGDRAGPPCLVAGAEPCSIVAVEILVEQDQVAPVRIFLEFLCASVDRPTAIRVAKERGGKPALDLLCHLEQRHILAGTGRALDFEVVAIKRVQVQERPDDQHIDGHPDGTPPVGVAAEHSRIRFGRQVIDFVFLAANPERERVIFVIAGQRTDSVRAKKLILVEKVAEHPLQFGLVQDRQQRRPLYPTKPSSVGATCETNSG